MSNTLSDLHSDVIYSLMVVKKGKLMNLKIRIQPAIQPKLMKVWEASVIKDPNPYVEARICLYDLIYLPKTQTCKDDHPPISGFSISLQF